MVTPPIADRRVEIKMNDGRVLDGTVSFLDVISHDFDLSDVYCVYVLDYKETGKPFGRYPFRVQEQPGLYMMAMKIKQFLLSSKQEYDDYESETYYPEQAQISPPSDRELINRSIRLRQDKLDFRYFISNLEDRLNQRNLGNEEISSLRLWLDNYRNAFNLDRESLSKLLKRRVMTFMTKSYGYPISATLPRFKNLCHPKSCVNVFNQVLYIPPKKCL